MKLRRPKDYVPLPDQAPVQTEEKFIPGIVSTNVPDTENKIFCGGLPSYLNEVFFFFFFFFIIIYYYFLFLFLFFYIFYIYFLFLFIFSFKFIFFFFISSFSLIFFPSFS